MEKQYNVIIVGAGLAGSAAAYELARNGLSVLVIERGNRVGAKNMTGGRIYTHSLEKLIPDFRTDAPLERRIAVERISLASPDGETTLSFRSREMKAEAESYTVLRAKLDPWLAGKAIAEGADYVCGIRVDELLERGGKVCGVRATGEEVEADVVILADGANSFLAQKLGMKGAVNPDSMAVGVKEVLEFGEKEIEKRFGLNAGEGLAWLSAGDSTGGVLGGGFLYTNRTTVSCGIVATLSEAGKSPYSVPEMLEHFKHSAGIEPLVSGGRLLEYSAHLVPEGGYKELPELFRSGVLLAGDAAGMVINLGIMVRGMDFAIESGRLAAQAVLEAKGDYSWQKLQRYRELLDESFVLRDMKKYQRVPEFLSSPRIFTAYPRMAEEILSAVFRVDGSKPVPMVLKAVPPVLRSGIPGLVKDAWKGVTSL